MIFNNRHLYELTLNDFELLIVNRIAENPNLEYKETAYSGRPEDIREMLRDIVSLANADGGYLILGIREDETGCAESIQPIENVFSRVQPIRQVCLDHICERIEGLEIRPFKTDLENGIIAIRIPKSVHRPHMVTRDNRTEFFRRYDTNKRTMSIDEIRSMVIADKISAQLIELGLTPNGKGIKLGKNGLSKSPPFIRILTERSVDFFLNKFLVCNSFPQNIVIVSPFISDLAGELVTLKNIIRKIDKDNTTAYILTRPPKEEYQINSIEILKQSPNIEIRYNDDIHAKLYICWCKKNIDESFAMFGSGNLTKGGLRQNLELGMMIFSKDQGRSIINDLYEWSTVGLRSQSIRITKPQMKK